MESLRKPAEALSGSMRAVLEASMQAARRHEAASVAIVVETEGSTYVPPGAMALFGSSEGQVGWLSGGCLEPEIERLASGAARSGHIEWLEIDTRDDDDLFAGSALGCRGRLRIALLPLRPLTGWIDLVQCWLSRAGSLRLNIGSDGSVTCAIADQLTTRWSLPKAAPPPQWTRSQSWRVEVPPPPSVLVFGAGPEMPILLPLLRTLGWITTLVERRERWTVHAALADVALDGSPETALSSVGAERCEAALVMHHNFELDREALTALAATDIGFIGLLGPLRRREDLFRVLPDAIRDALLPRLHSPVGLDLGGRGPEAIALSVAAQLHAVRHSR